MERGFSVHSLNPKQLDRFRDRVSPASAKDDGRAARTLADTLRTDRRIFRRLEPAAPELIQLRERNRIADALTHERTRLVNRTRQRLWRYYLQFVIVNRDLTKAWIPEPRRRASTPAKAKRLRPATVEKFLICRRARTISAQDVLEILREPANSVAPGTAEAAVARMLIIIKWLKLITSELSNAYRRMDQLTASFAVSQESNPGEKPQRDAANLASLPGVSRTVPATLLTEARIPSRTAMPVWSRTSDT